MRVYIAGARSATSGPSKLKATRSYSDGRSMIQTSNDVRHDIPRAASEDHGAESKAPQYPMSASTEVVCVVTNESAYAESLLWPFERTTLCFTLPEIRMGALPFSSVTQAVYACQNVALSLCHLLNNRGTTVNRAQALVLGGDADMPKHNRTGGNLSLLPARAKSSSSLASIAECLISLRAVAPLSFSSSF